MHPTDDPPAPAADVDTSRRTHTEPFDPHTGPVETIVDLVAALEEASPLEMPPLYDTVDPDALNTLFARGDDDCVFAFTYEGYRVRVHGAGHVEVTRPEHPSKVTGSLE